MKRDIAMLAPKSLTYDQIKETITAAKIKYLTQFELFDHFESDEKLGPDKKSIALSFIYQSTKKTLQDDTVNRLHDQLITYLTKTLPIEIR